MQVNPTGAEPEVGRYLFAVKECKTNQDGDKWIATVVAQVQRITDHSQTPPREYNVPAQGQMNRFMPEFIAARYLAAIGLTEDRQYEPHETQGLRFWGDVADVKGRGDDDNVYRNLTEMYPESKWPTAIDVQPQPVQAQPQMPPTGHYNAPQAAPTQQQMYQQPQPQPVHPPAQQPYEPQPLPPTAPQQPPAIPQQPPPVQPDQVAQPVVQPAYVQQGHPPAA